MCFHFFSLNHTVVYSARTEVAVLGILLRVNVVLLVVRGEMYVDI
jgi:hypothetical protein